MCKPAVYFLSLSVAWGKNHENRTVMTKEDLYQQLEAVRNRKADAVRNSDYQNAANLRDEERILMEQIRDKRK